MAQFGALAGTLEINEKISPSGPSQVTPHHSILRQGHLSEAFLGRGLWQSPSRKRKGCQMYFSFVT
jgi:hypothetical protein